MIWGSERNATDGLTILRTSSRRLSRRTECAVYMYSYGETECAVSTQATLMVAALSLEFCKLTPNPFTRLTINFENIIYFLKRLMGVI